MDLYFSPGTTSPDGAAAPGHVWGESAADPSGVSGATEAAGAPESSLVAVEGVHLAELPIDSIRANPRQPRTVFDEDDHAELVTSVRTLGLLQPVVVRPIPGSSDDDPVRYELVMGERRWRACRDAGLEVLPAIVRETADDAMLRDALLENLHRSQLNPLEEAAAYQQLLADFGCTQEQLAERVGRSRPQVSNTLRLLRLPPLVQRRVAAGVLSAGHARALLGLEDPVEQEVLAQRIVAEGLSVRAVEELVALGGPEGPRQRGPRVRREVPPELGALTGALADRLDTRVRVELGARKGRMTIEFAGVEDLRRILATLSPS
jgi:ParB family chromosome partitioning protein